MCLARTGGLSEDPPPPTDDIDRLRSTSTIVAITPRPVTGSERRVNGSEGKDDEGEVTATLLSERTPETRRPRCPPGFRNTPQFEKPVLETSPGFERAYEVGSRPPQEKTMPPEERVAEWITTSETTDEVPELEEAEMRGMFVYRSKEAEEEVDTGLGKSNSASRETSTVSSETSGKYHSFGAAQVEARTKPI